MRNLRWWFCQKAKKKGQNSYKEHKEDTFDNMTIWQNRLTVILGVHITQ